jgi:hypothetical protein
MALPPTGASRVTSRDIDLPVVKYPAQGPVFISVQAWRDAITILCERYHNVAQESRHSSGEKSTHSAFISTLEGNVLSIENRHFVGDDAVDVVPDGSERTQQALAGAYSPGAPYGAAMSVVASEAC